MDKRFLLHLKISVRKDERYFLRLVPFFQNDQSNKESSKQPSGRCSNDGVLRYPCFQFLKNTSERVHF